MGRLGYLIGSHVVYQHGAVPILLASMIESGVSQESIVVIVAGSGIEHVAKEHGVRFFYVTGETTHPFRGWRRSEARHDFDYWFYLDSTSRCGPRFHELAEAGLNEHADATRAGVTLSLTHYGGTDGRAINNLAAYKTTYLESYLTGQSILDSSDINAEGIVYAHAPKQAQYPNIGLVVGNVVDVYGTGVCRSEEYYTAVDLHRYKKNFGQLTIGHYKLATL